MSRTMRSAMMTRNACEGFPRDRKSPQRESAHEDALRSQAKDAYRRFSAREPSLPIFSRAWWLDAVAGSDRWNVALVSRNNLVRAAMPYVQRHILGMRLLGQPVLTRSLGPWLCKLDGKPAARMACERELMQALIDQLPPFDHFAQNWHASRTDWLPFYWNGFAQTTRYSYLLPALESEAEVWNRFRHGARTECGKAVKRYRLQVRDDLPLESFLALNRQTFAHHGLAMPYSDSLVKRLDAACVAHACRKIFVAVDGSGRPYAGVYIVWDENTTYALMSGIATDLRTSGAASLCFLEAIRHAARTTGRFDFGGSMMQPVERFFRSFGAHQEPYFSISKTPSLLLRMRRVLMKEWGTA